MTRSAIGTGVLVTCWVVAATAQQRPEPPTEPAHQVYVLTGCLEGGDAASSFKLTGAAAVGQAPPAQKTSSPALTKPDEYVVQPVSGVGEQGISRESLQGHVGQRVEVTVRPVDILPNPSSSASTDAKGKPEEPPPARYTVVKIGKLADSCG